MTIRLEMKNRSVILTEKQQKYCRKIDQYEYFTGEEILLSHQRQITEQAKLG